MTLDFPYPFTPKRCTIDGHSLSYIDEGQGRTVVMLHGNPTWSFYYRNLALLLRKKYRVIVPDHLGCGFSDKPQNYPYRLINHIDNLEKLLDAIKTEKVTLIMHDWGGAIGMGYAVRHRERIESLVVSNTAAFRSRNIPFRIRICRMPVLGPFLVRELNLFSRAAVTMAVSKRLTPEIARGYLAPYDSWENRIAIQRFVEDIPLSTKHPSWPTLLGIEGGLKYFASTPVLLLWGGRDFCFNRYFFEEWKRRFPLARSCYFKDAGHYLLEDAFQEVSPVVSGFLSEL